MKKRSTAQSRLAAEMAKGKRIAARNGKRAAIYKRKRASNPSTPATVQIPPIPVYPKNVYQDYQDMNATPPDQLKRQIARANIAYDYAYGPGSMEERYKEVISEIYNAFEKFKILHKVHLHKINPRR